ncbi:MAG: hypothetical protein ABIR06_11870, partial [Cyclobacteriaceae bacterium]
DPIVPIANGGQTQNAFGLQGGQNYLVEATIDQTGCKNTFGQLLADNSVVPVLTITPSDNSICDVALVFNGSVTQNTLADPNAVGTDTYTFAWSAGNDMTAIIGGQVASTLSGRDGGFYTATVRNNRLNCISNPVTAQVINNQILPAISAAPTPSTNCAAGTPNGQIIASITNVAGAETYAYQWYTGNTVTAGSEVPTAPNTGNTQTAIQLQGGLNFTVNVRNNTTGCTNFFTQALGDISDLATFSLSVVNNQKCIAPFDGSVTITGLTDNNSLVTDTYDVTWYDANVSGGPVSQSNLNISQGTLGASSARTARDNGFYTVTIANNRLGCTSNPVTGEVLDALVIPTITTLATPSTNCVGGITNGSAAVTGILPADTYEHRWYAGSLVAGPTINTGINDVDIAGLQGGAGANYTVEVTRTTTGCTSTETVTILDDSQIPVVGPLTHTDNLNCSAPFNGTATVPVGAVTYRTTTINNPYAGFTLNFDGVNADNITTRAAGTYSFDITHVADNCISNPVSVTILDDLVYPIVSTTITDQTSCGAPNGRIQSSETSGLGAYTFDWYQGIGIGAIGTELAESVEGTTTPVLSSNNYSVVVKNTATRCVTTQTSFLPNNIVLPNLFLTVNSDVTSCNTPNGEVQVDQLLTTVTSFADGDFTIFYLNQDPNNFTIDPNDIKGTPSLTSSLNVDLIYSNLVPGDYSALIRDESTDCESQAVTVTVDDITLKATITINAIAQETACNAGNDGGIDISVAGGVFPYFFDWYVGAPTDSPPFDFFLNTNPPNFNTVLPFTTTEDIAGQTAQLYTVVVRDTEGCGTVLSIGIPFQDAPRFSAQPANSSKCDITNGDGELNIQLVGQSIYTINIYSGFDLATAGAAIANFPIGTNLIDDDGDGTPDPLDLLDNDAGSFLCTNGLDDDLDLLIDSSDPDCDTGSAIAVDGLDNDADGLIDDADPDLDGAFPEKVYKNVPSLDPGGYLIEILDAATPGCGLYKTATIGVDAKKPVVALGAIVPNQACDAEFFASGTVEITVDKAPLDLTIGPPIYEITNLSAPGPSPPTIPATWTGFIIPQATPTVLFQGIFAGIPADGGFGPQTYKITITENNSGCSVDQFVTIPDQPVIPQLLQVDITNETFCAPLSNGSAEITAVNPVAINDYVYTWYSDAGLTTPIYSANGNLAGGGELFNVTKPGYSAGTNGIGYGNQTVYVRGERLPGTGPGVGCPTPAVTVVIQDEHATPVSTLVPLPNTSCDPLVGEGSISITTITTSPDVAVANGLYTYDINPDPNGAGPDPGNTGTVAFLFDLLTENGNVPYSVTTTNDLSGCQVQNNITIQPNKFQIDITSHIFANQLICNPDGEIDVTEIIIDRSLTGQGNLTFAGNINNNFDFEWFRAPAGTPGTFNPASPLTDPLANGGDVIATKLLTGNLIPADGEYETMGAGSYYVIATRKGGVAATAPVVGLGCETPPLRVDIQDQHVNPVVTLTPFSDTSCTGPGEGSIEVDVADASVIAGPFTYNFVWTTTVLTPPVTANPYNGINNLFTPLDEGDYTNTVTNSMTGCTASATTTIFKNVTPIFVTDIEIVPQFYCDPSGRIEVTAIEFTDRLGATITPPIPDFDFAWTRAGVGVGTTSAALDSTAFNYPGIGFGQYTVAATRTAGAPGLGCVSAPINVNIQDKRIFPVLTLTPFSNTSCTVAFEGQIEVDLTDASVPKVPAAAFNYDYTWTAVNPVGLTVPGPQAAQTGVNNLFTGLEDGTYQLQAVNAVTGCSTNATTTIIKNQTPVFVQNVDMVPQFYCDPSGNLDVVQVSFNDRTGAPVVGPLNNFTYTWSQNTLANVILTTDPTLAQPPGHIGTELDSVVFPAIIADSYYVVATRKVGTPGAGCSSAPYKIDVTDQHVNPAITLTPFSNTSCTVAFEGQIEVDVTDASAAKIPPSAFNYDYTWSVVSPVGLGLPPNQAAQNGVNNLYANLEDGTYKLQAVNNVTGCSSEATTTIIKNQTPVFLTVVNPTPQFYCEPSGRLEVTGVSYNDRNGNPVVGVTNQYSYRWARGTPAATVATTLGSDPRGTFLDSLVYAGIGFDPDYYVVATRTTGSPGAGCSSAPIKVEVTDRREYPNIVLTPFSNTSCTVAFEGEIEIDITDAAEPKVAPSPDAGALIT